MNRWAIMSGHWSGSTLSRYQLALAQKNAGELKTAGDAFAALGDYEDASQQASDCYDQLYGAASATAGKPLRRKITLPAMRVLQDADRTNLPEPTAIWSSFIRRRAIPTLTSCIGTTSPHRAMPFYQEAIGYRDAESKLKRRAPDSWFVGVRQRHAGRSRTDGTCTLLGEELYFRVSNFSLLVGNSPDDLKSSFQISQLTAKGMSLRDLRDGSKRGTKIHQDGGGGNARHGDEHARRDGSPDRDPCPPKTPQPEDIVQPEAAGHSGGRGLTMGENANARREIGALYGFRVLMTCWSANFHIWQQELAPSDGDAAGKSNQF